MNKTELKHFLAIAKRAILALFPGHQDDGFGIYGYSIVGDDCVYFLVEICENSFEETLWYYKIRVENDKVTLLCQVPEDELYKFI